MSKAEAIAQILKVFREYGYEGATLTRLSQATGLGKASLYHYFPKGKEEMAQAVLNYLNDWIETRILTSLRSDEEPTARIRAMSTKLDELYDHGQQACLLAVLSVGDAKNLFHVQIQKALLLWIDSLAQVFVDAGFEPNQAQQKAEDAILQIQGALILTQGLNDPAPFKRVLKHLPQAVLR